MHLQRYAYPLVLACSTLGAVVFAEAQNLVPNGHLEQFVACPTNVGQLEYASSWNNPAAVLPGMASPDYFNTCATYPGITVPISNFGDQVPLTGNGYLGLSAYFEPVPDFREYASVELLSPLNAGECYIFHMYVSRGEQCNAAIDHLGIHFADTAINDVVGSGPLPLVPQLLNTTGLLQDDLNWTQVSGLYMAHGGENHLVIGNFRDDATTNVVLVDAPGAYLSAYYFIDEVYLGPMGCITTAMGEKPHMRGGLFPNPAEEKVHVSGPLILPAELELFDAVGRSVGSWPVGHDGGVSLTGLPAGAYGYVLHAEEDAWGRFIKR
ncbi:MAG: T9SS type A sorting domain-containing protein [Flavobacteriales bacterium]|nr:T9SS type A sorting domain-containing protein [Flavobacteriales bacterium]MBP6696180.1 T9SS type A sorting domain-containing protein [Flavobacteriales bacterium]